MSRGGPGGGDFVCRLAPRYVDLPMLLRTVCMEYYKVGKVPRYSVLYCTVLYCSQARRRQLLELTALAYSDCLAYASDVGMAKMLSETFVRPHALDAIKVMSSAPEAPSLSCTSLDRLSTNTVHGSWPMLVAEHAYQLAI